jgi:hypothetical protein
LIIGWNGWPCSYDEAVRVSKRRLLLLAIVWVAEDVELKHQGDLPASTVAPELRFANKVRDGHQQDRLRSVVVEV